MKKLKISIVVFLWFLLISDSFAQKIGSDNIHEEHVTFLASDELEGRGLGTTGKLKARDYIRDAFVTAGLKPYKGNYLQDFQVRMGLAWVPGVNVVGVLEGTDPVLSQEYIVIGAHYDHLGYTMDKGKKTIFPGADDNASGVSAVIELAKHFTEKGNRPKRSIIFMAFDAEESGLLGANFFANELKRDEVAKVKAMFSFDMVGMYNAYGGLDLKGIASLDGVLNTATTLAEEHKIKLKNVSDNIENRTDTYPFAKRGIPSVHVFTGLKSPYHKPEDKSNLLDYKGMEKIHNYMADFITALGNQSDLEAANSFASNPSFTEVEIEEGISPKRDHKLFRWGVNVNLGSSRFNFSDEYYDAKNVFNVNAGLFYRVNLSKSLSIQNEFLYEYGGSKFLNNKNYRANAITIPLNLQFGPELGAPGLRMYVSAGAFYRYTFSNNLNDFFNDYKNHTFNDNEFGYSLGLGFDFGKYSVGYTFRKSLTNLNDTSISGIPGNITTNAGFATLSYSF